MVTSRAGLGTGSGPAGFRSARTCGYRTYGSPVTLVRVSHPSDVRRHVTAFLLVVTLAFALLAVAAAPGSAASSRDLVLRGRVLSPDLLIRP